MNIDIENSLLRKRVNKKKNSKMSKIPTSIWWVVGGSLFGIPCLIFVICIIVTSVHFVNEGHLAVYFKYGALQEAIGHPGLNWKTPFIMSHQLIKIRPTSDILEPFGAVTKDSIPITFHDIEVISSVPQNNVIWLFRKFGSDFKTVLLFERLKEETRRHCFGHDIDEVYSKNFSAISDVILKKTIDDIQRLGEGKIEILNLIIPKPRIPLDIAKNYQRVKVQYVERLVAEKEQEKQEVIKQTQELKAVADANRNKAVKIIDLEKQLLEKETQKNISQIENERYRLAEENKANVMKFRGQKEAEANALILTDQYVKLKIAEMFSTNSKLYFSGEKTVFSSIFSKLLSNI